MFNRVVKGDNIKKRELADDSESCYEGNASNLNNGNEGGVLSVSEHTNRQHNGSDMQQMSYRDSCNGGNLSSQRGNGFNRVVVLDKQMLDNIN